MVHGLTFYFLLAAELPLSRCHCQVMRDHGIVLVLVLLSQCLSTPSSFGPPPAPFFKWSGATLATYILAMFTHMCWFRSRATLNLWGFHLNGYISASLQAPFVPAKPFCLIWSWCRSDLENKDATSEFQIYDFWLVGSEVATCEQFLRTCYRS